MALVVDTGVLLATIDRRDRWHLSCIGLMESIDEPVVIPELVLPEVDYMLATTVGGQYTKMLLDDIAAGAFTVERTTFDDYKRIAEILEKYSDADVGLVDASILATVERLGETKLATLDRKHFSLMRPRHVDALQLLPEVSP